MQNIRSVKLKTKSAKLQRKREKTVVLSFKLLFFAFSFTFFAFLLPQTANAGFIVKAPPYIGLQEGLVGFWSFDGPDMSQSTNNVWALDRSGQGNNGQLTNMATSSARKIGKIGQALDFDGVDDYVNPGLSIFNSLSQGTISAWVKWESGTSAIFSHNNSAIGEGQLELYIDSSGNLSIWANNNDANGSAIAIDAGVAISNPTAWHHVVFTNNTSGNKLYIDGNQVTPTYSTGNASVDFFFDNSSDAGPYGYEIGGVAGTDGETFNGIIDEVRVYNRALSPDEIKRLYKIGSTFVVNKTRQDTLREGLVGHWSFDGTDMDGNRALDRSGQGNTGALTNGPKKVAGKIGQALDFDGVNDYVNAGTGSSLSLLGPVTISAWIYPRTFGGASKGRIVVRGTSGIAHSVGFSVNNSDITAGLSFGSHYDVSTLQTYSSNNTITLNTWQHVTVTWDGTTDRTKVLFYVNGIKTGRQDNGDGSDGSVTRVSDSTCSLLIGVQGGDGGDCNVDNGTRDFNGQIDEVRIYNRALTPDEIKRLYKIGSTFVVNKTRTDTLREGLVGHWSFDGPDMDGNRALDRSGQGNTGALTGGPKRVAGKIGQALDFDGSDDHVTTTNIAQVNSATYFTLSVWLKQSTSGGQDETVVGKYDSSLGHFELLTGHATRGPDAMYFRLFFLAGVYTDDATHELGVWENWVVVFDGTKTGNTERLNMYKNGLKLSITGENAIDSTTPPDNGLPVRIAQRGDIAGAPFNGQIDEVRIYNRALTPDEIKRLYQMGR